MTVLLCSTGRLYVSLCSSNATPFQCPDGIVQLTSSGASTRACAERECMTVERLPSFQCPGIVELTSPHASTLACAGSECYETVERLLPHSNAPMDAIQLTPLLVAREVVCTSGTLK